jgi:hypothetical protein
MLYFDSFPKIASTDYKTNAIAATNIMARTNMIPSLARNPLLFYAYDIQEGDTPEIVASKYYGDVDRHWMVLYANQILDPQWQWPLTSQQMLKYINDKYTVEANTAGSPSVVSYAQQTVKYYLKVFGTENSETGKTQTSMIIDEDEWTLLQPDKVTQTFSNGESVSKFTLKRALSIYDWEMETNERKRKIFLINNIYAPQIESQFKELMSR